MKAKAETSIESIRRGGDIPVPLIYLARTISEHSALSTKEG